MRNGNKDYGVVKIETKERDQTYGRGDQTYGKGDQTYGNRDQTYGKGDQAYGKGDQANGKGVTIIKWVIGIVDPEPG